MLVCRKVHKNGDGYSRFLVDYAGNESVSDAMAYLNSKTSLEKNLLSTMFVFNRGKDIVAELGSRLSVVHIYSLAEDFCRTVSVGRTLEEIGKIETLEQDDMPKAYYEAKAFSDFFVGLYLGTTIRELDEDTYSPPQLHFFSWEGKLLAKIDLPVRSLFFDIDTRNRQLYVVESVTEKILRYDISVLLERL